MDGVSWRERSHTGAVAFDETTDGDGRDRASASFVRDGAAEDLYGYRVAFAGERVW